MQCSHCTFTRTLEGLLGQRNKTGALQALFSNVQTQRVAVIYPVIIVCEVPKQVLRSFDLVLCD